MTKAFYLFAGLFLISAYVLGQARPDTLLSMGYERAKLDDLSFKEFFTERTKYPINAVRDNIEGVVVLSFEIDSVGNIDKIEIIENPNSLLSLEAVLSLQKSEGSWIPAELNGSNINETYLAIFSFLNKSTKEKYSSNQSKAAKYLKKGKFEHALKAISKAEEINSYDPKLYQTKSIIYQKLGERELSDKTIKKIQDLNNRILFSIELYIYTVIRTVNIKQ
jgi:tetratricopeptide (TPR) repeat protein